MRVIRTEMYFDTMMVEGLTGAKLDNPGIAAAWFAAPSDSELDLTAIGMDFKSVVIGEIEQFIVDALIDFHSRRPESKPIEGRIYARSVPESFARYILEQPVIIEHSPAESIPLEKLLKGTSGTAIGAYIGYAIAGDSPLLLLITVPGGIMVVTSAIGISIALANGLNKIVSDAFKKKK